MHKACLTPSRAGRVRLFASPIAAILLSFGLLAAAVGALHAQAGETQPYTVQAGETLSEIAAAFGVDADTLLELNGIEDANAIYEGQVLLVPAEVPTDLEPVEEPATLEPTPAEPGGALPATHIVQAGETLTGIARFYGLPAATLKALNGLGDADFIVVGQELILSVAALPPTPTPEPTIEPTPEPTLEPTVPVETEAAQEPAPATPQPTEADPPTSMPDMHTVQAGETLTGIARRYGLALEALQALNGIDDENAIYVGQELRLLAPTPEPTAGPPPTATPDPDGSPNATPEPEAAPAETVAAPIVRSGNAAASLNRTYQVVFGDTLGRIALREGLDADALAGLNGFADVDAPLNAGATLLLPATGDELRPSTPAQEHIVEPGESLSAIAQGYGVSTTDLMAANSVSDANAIYSGQRLLIPSLPVGGEGDVVQQLGPASSGYFFYTVQPGDTLSAVAKQFGSTMEALRTYNGLPDNETVYTGLELKIPFGPPSLPLNLPPVPMSGTRFVISLSRQQCWVFEGDKVRYAWNCSTGQTDRKTKAGNFAVQSKIPNAKSKVWELDMPYWLGIYDVGEVENGIHGLPMAWSSGKKIWSGLIGQPATFGCAMLDDANASTLYRMAFLGMPVHIVN